MSRFDTILFSPSLPRQAQPSIVFSLYRQYLKPTPPLRLKILKLSSTSSSRHSFYAICSQNTSSPPLNRYKTYPLFSIPSTRPKSPLIQMIKVVSQMPSSPMTQVYSLWNLQNYLSKVQIVLFLENSSFLHTNKI